MADDAAPRVAWLFSLARSGSSVSAYAAAAPWNHAVADEPFGPWDRTAEPYNYPPQQAELKSVFYHAGERLSPEAVTLADQVLETIATQHAGKTGRVIVKHPHTMLTPDDWKRVYGSRGHGRVIVLRNPLHRLNSMLVRNQQGAIGTNWDLDTFKVVAQRWLDADPVERIVYEDLRRDPRAFFTAMYRAWRWPATPANIDAAIAYAQANYHAASKRVNPQIDPKKGVVSEWKRALTAEIVRTYLDDPMIRRLCEMAGWPTRESEYLS